MRKERLMEANNINAMREALEKCTNELCEHCKKAYELKFRAQVCCESWCDTVRIAKAALAAPPRNCDRFATWEEAMQSFRRLALHEKPLALWLGSEIEGFARWLFASSQEGATDGSK